MASSLWQILYILGTHGVCIGTRHILDILDFHSIFSIFWEHRAYCVYSGMTSTLASLGYSGIVNFPSRLSLYLLNYPWRFVLISLSIIPTERRVQQCPNSGLAYSVYSGFSWHILDILT